MRDPLAIYLHWPFCKSKCPYCDFNSHVRPTIDQARWREAYVRELDHYAEETKGRPIASIFFGGGTPSLMAPETVSAILERIARHWTLGPETEITLEANPTSVEAGRFAGFATAGINRLSLGVQALDDASLIALGRRHSAAEAMRAIDLARSHFPRFSFDLIYARPGQSAAMWEDELGLALTFQPRHLSVYQLTIEDGTPFQRLYDRGDLVPPDEDAAADLYERTQRQLAVAGLPAYEISNHAALGEESRHNLVYWRYGDYLGIGPGAHGRLTGLADKRATSTLRLPERWLEQVETLGHGLLSEDRLTREDRATECLMMGLRLAEGVPLARLARESDADAFRTVNKSAMATLTKMGLLAPSATHITATAAGRQRLNTILTKLLT